MPDIDGEIIGQYQLTPDFGIGVYQQNGALVSRASGQVAVLLHAIGDDWYAMGLADASLRFTRSDGEVTGLELVQNGLRQSASKVSDRAAVQERQAIELDATALEEFVGEYQINEAAAFTIRLSDEGLEAMLTGQPFFPIFAKGDDVFFYRVVDAELHFERDDGGAVDALVLHQGSIVQRAMRR